LIAHEVFLKGKPPTLIEYLASKVAGKLCRKTLQWKTLQWQNQWVLPLPELFRRIRGFPDRLGESLVFPVFSEQPIIR